jgi:tryptophan 2,3-dioxygenase
MPDTSPPAYWDYLRLDDMLSLQGGLEGDEDLLSADETHFIIVHQAFELWFKLILKELRLARDHLVQPKVPEAAIPHVVHHLKRVTEILKLLVIQFRVVETLTPQGFLDFRDKLAPASGFQSFQQRELEILLGTDMVKRTKYGSVDALDHLRKSAAGTKGGAKAVAAVERALAETSLKEALSQWLYRTPIRGSQPDDPGDDEVVNAFLEEYLASWQEGSDRQLVRLNEVGAGSPEALEQRFAGAKAAAISFLRAEDVPDEKQAWTRRVRAGLVFIESYRELPLLAWPRLLVDMVVELEEYLVRFRTRHARMVERTIGRRTGTGGSAGVDYLDETTKMRIFTDLWTVRTLLVRKDDRPPLPNADFYDYDFR